MKIRQGTRATGDPRLHRLPVSPGEAAIGVDSD